MPEYHVKFRVCIESRLLEAQLAWCEAVVGVQECEELAVGSLDRAVARRTVSCIGLAEVSDLGETLGDLGSAVIRAVVDKDQFHRLVILSEHAADRFAHVGGGV